MFFWSRTEKSGLIAKTLGIAHILPCVISKPWLLWAGVTCMSWVGGYSSPFHKNLYKASPHHSQHEHTAHNISKQNAIALQMQLPDKFLNPPSYQRTPKLLLGEKPGATSGFAVSAPQSESTLSSSPDGWSLLGLRSPLTPPLRRSGSQPSPCLHHAPVELSFLLTEMNSVVSSASASIPQKESWEEKGHCLPLVTW